MAFSFNDIRNLFVGQTSEPVQSSLTPASGIEIVPAGPLEKAADVEASFQAVQPPENDQEVNETEGRNLLESSLEKRYLP